VSKGFQIVILFFAWLASALAVGMASANDSAKRPVTVIDTIRMRTLAENFYAGSDQGNSRFASFSPDGKHFVVVTARGIPETNENEYSLLLYATKQAFQHPMPKLLISMRSRSNRDAIKNVRWIGNVRLYFVGEQRDTAQVYSIDITTRVLKRWTGQPTPVVGFDVDPKGKTLLYAAEPGPPSEKAVAEKTEHGYAITTETLFGIPRTRADFREPDFAKGENIFVKCEGLKARQVLLLDRYSSYKPISIAPDGRRAVVAVLLRDVPGSWIDYEDELVKAEVQAYRRRGSTTSLMQYMLIDLKAATVEPLLTGPIAWSTGATAWSSDGKRIVVSGAFLPLDVSDPSEREERRKHSFAVIVNVETHRFEKLTTKDVVVSSWDAASDHVFFRSKSGTPAAAGIVFIESGSGWVEESDSAQALSRQNLPVVTLDQDLNAPPRLYVEDSGLTRKSLLLDLNPQFAGLELARVEAIRWRASDGHEVEGGLYIPPGYKKGVRCPLVIQTHGFSETEFWIDGPWNSAFAAQPLAARGIMVLQVGHGTEAGGYMKHHRSLEEAPREMAAYEGAIDYLDKQGMIERDRVGIIGFSRTQYHVAYTLTHSSYQFAAVTLADGFDGGYLQYLANPYSEKDHVFVNGGPPFGATFENWLEHSPAFRIDRVHSPVRVECYGSGVVGCWEWFSVLTHLGRPVDLIYLPQAVHILVKPWERLTSQQGNVDWFCFWLLRQEDSDPRKHAQYERWRAMREAKPIAADETSR
jgi:dipeptidyl aminopeptidase/acylaminoacyl peptidase